MNGKTGEYVRWVIGLLLAGFIAYSTAQATITSRIAAVEATQDSQFGEVLRRMDILQADIRELRNRER